MERTILASLFLTNILNLKFTCFKLHTVQNCKEDGARLQTAHEQRVHATTFSAAKFVNLLIDGRNNV